MHHEGDPVWVAHQRAPEVWHLTRWAAEGYGVRPPACGVRALGWVPWLWAAAPAKDQQCRRCLHIATLAGRAEARTWRQAG